MSKDFEVRGTEQFLKLSKALKQAGRTELRKELHKGLRDGAKPLIGKARAAARAELPKRGGLDELVARSPMRVQVRTGAQTAGVRVVVGKNRSGARGANRGVVRHPVFGNREVWRNTKVTPGWFDDTMRGAAPQVRPELEKAIERVVEKIVKGAH